MTFYEKYKSVDILKIKNSVANRDTARVNIALKKEKIDFSDFLALLSPAAEKFLEQMAYKSRALTSRHFGKNVQLYIPMYISNECENSCAYCGFNSENPAARKTLSTSEVIAEFEHIKALGFQNILLLTGEAPEKTGVNFLIEIIRLAKNNFAFVGLEIYPAGEEEYKKMIDAGADGLTVYQETYDENTYRAVHLNGPKRDFMWRLTTPDRAASAGFRKIGIGALLGLHDWRTEAAYVGLHADYLVKKYWRTEISISFPRLRDCASGFEPPHPVSEKELVQMIFALRIFLPTVGMTLSTRESPSLRDNLIGYGITMMSAGSRTNPGGYSGIDTERQFITADVRPVDEIIRAIRKKGYYPVFKDWDANIGGVIHESND